MTQKLPSVLKGAQIASHRIYSTWNGIGNLYKNIMMDLVHKGPPPVVDYVCYHTNSGICH